MEAIASNSKEQGIPAAPRRRAGLALVAASLLLAACNIVPPPQADPTRFFVLTSRPVAAATTLDKALVVGLGVVEVPAYLKTKSIVVRLGANEVRYHDYARWGETLEQGVGRVVREDLSTGGAQVMALPSHAERTRDVYVRLIHCEGTAAGGISFSAAWEISNATGTGIIARGTYTAGDLKWNGKDFSQLAERLSDAIAGLSAEIATALAK